MKYRVGLVSPD